MTETDNIGKETYETATRMFLYLYLCPADYHEWVRYLKTPTKLKTNEKDFRFYQSLMFSRPKTFLLSINRLLIKLQDKEDLSQHFSVAKQLFERFMKLLNLEHSSIKILKSRKIGEN